MADLRKRWVDCGNGRWVRSESVTGVSKVDVKGKEHYCVISSGYHIPVDEELVEDMLEAVGIYPVESDTPSQRQQALYLLQYILGALPERVCPLCHKIFASDGIKVEEHDPSCPYWQLIQKHKQA